jgi:hypothetical protein
VDYYPDCITFRDMSNHHQQKLEPSPPYIRISKPGIWTDRQVAIFQESASNRFHAGWSNFADWVNDSVPSNRKLTYRQSQRLWTEHFSRRLLVFHDKIHTFPCNGHPSTRVFSEAVRDTVGVNGGVLGFTMTHGCAE